MLYTVHVISLLNVCHLFKIAILKTSIYTVTY